MFHAGDYIANILFESKTGNVNMANKTGFITVCDNRLVYHIFAI